MHIRPSAFITHAGHLGTAELRAEFLASGLFRPGAIVLQAWEVDRTVIGGIVPTEKSLTLHAPESMRASFFFERREAGLVNLGGPGTVTVDGTDFPLERLDALYIGRGSRVVSCCSADSAAPARFYLLSYPAHAAYPTRSVSFRDTPGNRLGQRESANERVLTKLIHPGAFPTCQVVMGVTRLEPGSVWNTMPAHTHDRRSEVYLYFDIPPGQVVFHLMGQPQETRHLVIRDSEAVLSPPWSIHSGCGTSAYAFVWGMGGENQEFTDMDGVAATDLR